MHRKYLSDFLEFSLDAFLKYNTAFMRFLIILLPLFSILRNPQRLLALETITEEYVVGVLSGEEKTLNYTPTPKNNTEEIPLNPSPGVAFNIHFDYDSAEINKTSHGVLIAIGKSLESNALKDLKFMIIGHTDSLGTPQYNMVLSLHRAENVKKFIAEHFSVPGERLIGKGLGASEPIATNDTEAGRGRNRRVEIIPLTE